jgi:UDP-N-acetylmuramate--alanine ligase
MYVYFIGIGGIGMSALARWYAHKGWRAAGYDRTPTPLTAALCNEGIAVHYEDKGAASIPASFRYKGTLVIYTPAVGDDNAELQYFQGNGNRIIKRSAALGLLTDNDYLLAVAGTHGKTTTSTMLAHILKTSRKPCCAFLGGISKNYNTNLLLAPEAHPYVVAEADEYDRSFLQLHPSVAIVTSADADHLDIYGDVGEMRRAYVDFINNIKDDGVLIIKNTALATLEKAAIRNDIKVYTYACGNDAESGGTADFYATDIVSAAFGTFVFNIVTPFGTITNCTVGVAGLMNVENAVAAVAADMVIFAAKTQPDDALLFNCERALIAAALQCFEGVARRLDVQARSGSTVYIDDYAHHPEELAATIAAIKSSYKNRKITGIFQPHLYTRTRDFAAEFAAALSVLDELILLDIYPAREAPIDGVTSQIIFDKVAIERKRMCGKDAVLDILRAAPREVVVTLGAGDIDTLVEPIREMFDATNK